MDDFAFYHLRRARLEYALPKLLEKVTKRGRRAVVRVGSEARLEDLNRHLWTYEERSFLAHGAASDGFAEAQPIYFTTATENPNGASVLVLVDGAEPFATDQFDRCLNLFDGDDPVALGAARERWRALKAASEPVTYWQQSERGGWKRRD